MQSISTLRTIAAAVSNVLARCLAILGLNTSQIGKILLEDVHEVCTQLCQITSFLPKIPTSGTNKDVESEMTKVFTVHRD